MNINVLYESEDFLIIDKPSGLMVHSDGKTKDKTLVDWILEKYPEIREVGEPGRDSHGNVIYRPGIVHRLDKETSGVMIVTKNQKSFEFLKNKFKNHEIEKTYHAFVYGQLKNDSGVIDRPIGRSSSDFRKWTAQRGIRGETREAQTCYRVLIKNLEYSLVEISPKTGRTHQIRVHFKAINHPLLGDSLYAPKYINCLNFDRLALHSYKIDFTYVNGEFISVKAEYPEDFKKALSLLQS